MPRRLIDIGVALAICLFPVSGTTARTRTLQAAPTAIGDLETIGPKVGEVLPDFTLPDQRGKRHSLKSLLGPKGAIIVFFRSADW